MVWLYIPVILQIVRIFKTLLDWFSNSFPCLRVDMFHLFH
jgi:hypothetical protein